MYTLLRLQSPRYLLTSWLLSQWFSTTSLAPWTQPSFPGSKLVFVRRMLVLIFIIQEVPTVHPLHLGKQVSSALDIQMVPFGPSLASAHPEPTSPWCTRTLGPTVLLLLPGLVWASSHIGASAVCTPLSLRDSCWWWVSWSLDKWSRATTCVWGRPLVALDTAGW